MPAQVVLRNRLPEIMANMTLTVPEALKVGAEAVAAEAQARAPVDTGRLRDSIEVKKIPTGGYYSAQSIQVGAFYGFMVEFGTSQAPAHPFLVPAFESLKLQIEAIIREALRRRLS